MPNQKGVAQILLLVILLAGLGGGLYLVQTRTNLLPKASEEIGLIQIVDKDGNPITETTDPNVYLKIYLPPGWQILTSDRPILDTSCPVNQYCCFRPIQTCQQNEDCLEGYKWCYSGYCIREDYSPEKRTCAYSYGNRHISDVVLISNDLQSKGSPNLYIKAEEVEKYLNKPIPWNLGELDRAESQSKRSVKVYFNARGEGGKIKSAEQLNGKAEVLLVQPPADKNLINVDILVLKYFPVDSGNSLLLNKTVTGLDYGLGFVRQKTDALTKQAVEKLTDASRYHGYKNPSPPAINLKVLETKEFLTEIPLAFFPVPWSETKAKRPDYMKILGDLNICDFVDNKGVDQIWVWSYHTASVEPAESNMSMGNKSYEFWTAHDGEGGMEYGDVSNSERLNDLPTCQRTYLLFNYNYQRGLGEMLENNGHQLEAVLRWVDEDLFWNKFVKPNGDKKEVNHCGWTHSPPNVTDNNQYDWVNESTVKSDCEDWRPDGGGQVKDVNCHTWYGNTCQDDTGAAFKVWWMQNIPGLNNGLTYKGKPLRNWWEFYGDFDAAVAKGKLLTE